ncbi:FMN-dependent NADH-azoreductase [Panacagrimonas perspica]|uniref:FMN dependent NADH:quinone oxidoreductase n=1 Tax=Panacagrimonas perspica TaxID=381431 RepID=A0A4R7NZU3_9GAMM|nr:NAD(P)H-dependent oxidoreductase [Panacagrimonas perspica]TDU26668.1 FMN-dependent NADH-azoreductase [Panacagrimonas perspica]THD04019.1 FMN-dependent NADH-azoreductase [Panacagrimonas perspica]
MNKPLNLLQINASLYSGKGQSSLLSERFVNSFRASHGDVRVVTRDVAGDPVPHLDARRFGAFLAAPEARTPEQQAVVDYSDTLIDELRAADVIVLGLPLYNFGVPSQLKAYFDHVARAGVTFRYTADGPVGLITGKKVYVLAARGGLLAGTPLDTQTSYVRDFLRFIGIEDVEFVYAEGLAISADLKARAIEQANDSIARLAA